MVINHRKHQHKAKQYYFCLNNSSIDQVLVWEIMCNIIKSDVNNAFTVSIKVTTQKNMHFDACVNTDTCASARTCTRQRYVERMATGPRRLTELFCISFALGLDLVLTKHKTCVGKLIVCGFLLTANLGNLFNALIGRLHRKRPRRFNPWTTSPVAQSIPIKHLLWTHSFTGKTYFHYISILMSQLL